MRTHGTCLMAVVVALMGGCRENPAIDDNVPPVAVAWVADSDFPVPRDKDCTAKAKKEHTDPDECPVDENARAMGCAVMGATECEKVVQYDSAPASVTLDATHSTDRNGEVVSYRWLSANFGTDCKGRDDDPAHDPKDTAKPKVTLDEGFWQFSLWVEDDEGATSEQSVVTVLVGAGATDPCPNGPAGAPGAGGSGGGDDAGTADGGGVDPAAQLACVMGCTATSCPAESTACDGNPMCWPLVSCVATKCADAGTDTMAITACAVAMCVEFLGGATEAQAVATCALDCRNSECAM